MTYRMVLAYDAGSSTMRIHQSPHLCLAHFPGQDDRLSLPRYDVSSLNPGILHIGMGAFHRAHQCTFFERLANAGETSCGVFGVSLQSARVHDALERQDHLYSLTTLDGVEPVQVIGCIRQSAGPDQLDQALAFFGSAELKLVTLTVTEKAYDDPDTDMVRFLTEGLRRRASVDLPLVVASCDNLVGNGRRLQDLVLASLVDDPLVHSWVIENVLFPNSMVDSITPRVTDDRLQKVEQYLGLVDEVPVQREPFAQWVLEACDLPFDLASAGVEIVPDVAPYETLKLRILNASHSLMAYAGPLLGHVSVREAVSDQLLAPVVERFMHEMAGQLELPATIDVETYIQTTLTRFSNPGVEHHLLQIAEDGSSKLRERVVPVLSSENDLPLLCLPIVFWVEFVRRRKAEGHPVIDPLADTLSGEPGSMTSLLGLDDGSEVVRWFEVLRKHGIETFLGECIV